MERFDCKKSIWLSPDQTLLVQGRGELGAEAALSLTQASGLMGTLNVTGRLKERTS